MLAPPGFDCEKPTVTAEQVPFRPPPGLELEYNRDQPDVGPPPGLCVAKRAEAEFDETSAGSAVSAGSHGSDSDCELPARSAGLVFSEHSQLKATAPMFQPLLSASSTSNVAPCKEQRTPLRATTLRSKADAFVPTGKGMTAVRSAKPFVPGASGVGNAKAYGNQDGVGSYGLGSHDLQWDGTASGSTSGGFSSYGLSSRGSNEYYSEQEWCEGWH